MDDAALDGLSPEMRARFDALRQIFAQGLAGRWREIQDTKTPQERVAALHRLAGASGSFGHARLCELARQAEHALRDGDVTTFNTVMPVLYREIEHILDV